MKLYPREEWLSNLPKDLGASYCVLCEKSEQEDYMIWEGDYWKIIHNKYPYVGQKKHIMAFPKKHIKRSHDLGQEELGELGEVYKFVNDFFGAEEYFSLTRESLGGRSLEHLHIHFIPGIAYSSDIEDLLLKQGFTNQLDSD